MSQSILLDSLPDKIFFLFSISQLTQTIVLKVHFFHTFHILFQWSLSFHLPNCQPAPSSLRGPHSLRCTCHWSVDPCSILGLVNPTTIRRRIIQRSFCLQRRVSTKIANRVSRNCSHISCHDFTFSVHWKGNYWLQFTIQLESVFQTCSGPFENLPIWPPSWITICCVKIPHKCKNTP